MCVRMYVHPYDMRCMIYIACLMKCIHFTAPLVSFTISHIHLHIHVYICALTCFYIYAYIYQTNAAHFHACACVT